MGKVTDTSRRFGSGNPDISFDSVDDLKNATGLQVGWKVRTLGYYSPGDGGGNDYEIVAATTGTDDGGSFIDLPGSGVQARGLFTDSVANVKQFGAKGDGLNNDTSFIQSALDSGISHIKFNEGRYVVSSSTNNPALTCSTYKVRVSGVGVVTVDQTTRRLIDFSGDEAKVQMNVDGNFLLADAIRVTGKGCIVHNCVVEDLFTDYSDCTGISAYDVSGGVTIRDNIVRNLEGTLKTETFGRFTRAIQFYCTQDATEESNIHDNVIEDIKGVEGDAVVVVAIPDGGGRVDAKVTLRNNTIKNFTRRAFKIQGYKVKIIGNYITHNFTNASEMSTVRNVIDFVQCRDGIISDNVLDGCKFCIQININEDGAYPVNNISITGNSIFGIGDETPNSVLFLSATNGSSLHVVNNYITVGAGRGVALSGFTGVNISNNTFQVSENASNPVVDVTSTVGGVLVRGNSVFGGSRDCFVRVSSNSTVVTGNYLNCSSPIYRGVGTVNESLVFGNINTAKGAYVGSIPRLRRGGNFLLSGTGTNDDGLSLMYGTSPSSFDNVFVREGQVIINVYGGSPLAWKAATSGIGSSVTWEAFGSAI